MNVAHHASYVAWFELARTEMLRDTGVPYAEIERGGVLLMVSAMEIRYRKPVRYDDLVEIRTRVASSGRASITHGYELFVVGGGRDSPAAEASITLACCDAQGRPRRLPEALSSSVGAGPASRTGPKRVL